MSKNGCDMVCSSFDLSGMALLAPLVYRHGGRERPLVIVWRGVEFAVQEWHCAFYCTADSLDVWLQPMVVQGTSSWSSSTCLQSRA